MKDDPIDRLLRDIGASGLVEAIHDPVLDRALETARLLAAKSPVALKAAKDLVNRALQGDHASNLAREADWFGELFAGEDAKEGLAAFVEKRPPDFPSLRPED